MVSKCANPDCTTRFTYLREGKLFRFEDLETAADRSQPHLVAAKKAPRRTEHFWLCGPCSAVMTVAYDRAQGSITTMPLPAPKARSAIAS